MKPKRLIIQAISIGLGILAACMVAEAVLRFTDVNDYVVLPVDKASGLSIHASDSSYEISRPCLENTVTDNNLGFHGPPVSAEKGKNVFRIVVSGGSFVEAEQVPVSEMFTTLLERKLNADPRRASDYEVIPLGFSGNGTFLDTLYFERFGESLKPDLVILLETEYESAHDDPRFTADGRVDLSLPVPSPSRSPSMDKFRNIYHHSKLIMNVFERLYSRYTELKQEMSDDLARMASFTDSASDSATSSVSKDQGVWDMGAKLMDSLVGTVSSVHARFLLATWAIPGTPTLTTQELRDQSQRSADRDHFPYLDLSPSIADQYARKGASPVWSCDNHWSQAGHEYAAESLYEYLKQNPKFLSK